MAMKEQQRQVYRSMQGKEVDMTKLMNQNEMTVAVGNAKVNARGDELGPGGKIVRKREDVLKEYYQDHPNTAPEDTSSRKTAKTADSQEQAEQTITGKLKG